MYNLKITQIAKSDIKDCYDYMYDVLKNDISANSLLDNIENALKQLQVDPEHNPKTNDIFLDLIGIRYIRINNYLCFCKIDNEKREFG